MIKSREVCKLLQKFSIFKYIFFKKVKIYSIPFKVHEQDVEMYNVCHFYMTLIEKTVIC